MGGAYFNLINMQKWAGLRELISLICKDGRGLFMGGAYFNLINMQKWAGLRELISLICIDGRSFF